jgi:hypothetical protein
MIAGALQAWSRCCCHSRLRRCWRRQLGNRRHSELVQLRARAPRHMPGGDCSRAFLPSLLRRQHCLAHRRLKGWLLCSRRFRQWQGPCFRRCLSFLRSTAATSSSAQRANRQRLVPDGLCRGIVSCQWCCRSLWSRSRRRREVEVSGILFARVEWSVSWFLRSRASRAWVAIGRVAGIAATMGRTASWKR